MMLEKLKETNEVFNFIICPRPFSQNLVLANFAGALTRYASVGRLEECFTGTALIRHLSAARCWRWPGVCRVCVARADFIEMGRHYYSQVTWSHSTYTLHQYTILTFVLPPEVATTTASQYQTLSISRLWKLYFVPSASRDHFWQHLRLKLRLKVETKKEDMKINHCRDFCLQLNDVPILAEIFANSKHSTAKSFISLTMLVESLVMGWRLETFLPGAHQINKAPLSTFLGTSSYHHYNFILQPWSGFLLQPSWAGLSHGCLYYGEHLMDLSYFNWNLDWEGFENNFLT